MHHKIEFEKVSIVAVTLSVVFGLSGIALAVLVGRKPHLFWPVLIAAAIGTSGIMIQGYALIDEYLAGCVILGGLVAIKAGAVPSRVETGDQLHRWVFLLMVTYLTIESIRGFLFLGDVRMIRWILFYLMFGLLALMLARWDFPIPNARKMPIIVAGSSIAYFGAYLAHGLTAEWLLGIPRWKAQGIEWAGSTYAMFPLVVALPAAISLIKDGDRTTRRIRWITVGLVVITGLYYESRISMLALAGMLCLSPLVLGLRRAMFFAMRMLLIGSVGLWFVLSPLATIHCRVQLFDQENTAEVCNPLANIPYYPQYVSEFVQKMVNTALEPIVPYYENASRALHIRIGLDTMMDDPIRLFVGSGVYTHRVLMSRELVKFRYGAPPQEVQLGPYFLRTTGLPAIMVDTGLVGLLLLGLNLLLSARALLHIRGDWRDAILHVLVLSYIPLWLVGAGNFQDIVLYFLMLMPGGILIFLGRRDVSDTSADGAIALECLNETS